VRKPFHHALLTGIAALGLAASVDAAPAGELKSVYFGRWTVDDPTDKFSANGKLYRVIDIAACGADFCGVSVEGGACGETLFRFLAIHANSEELDGHGKWGATTKKVILDRTDGGTAPAGKSFTLYVGEPSFTVASRSAMPTFVANYHRVGEAGCTAPVS
jgi:hypothetical protein